MADPGSAATGARYFLDVPGDRAAPAAATLSGAINAPSDRAADAAVLASLCHSTNASQTFSMEL